MATALTNATSLTNTIKSYYDRIMLDAMDPKLVYYQFGIKKPLPKNEGTSIIWNIPRRLALGFVLSEGVTTSTANALSTYKVSAVIRQFGGYTSVSDLVDLTSITDVMKLAAERIGAQAGETIERVIVNEVMVGHVNDLPATSCLHLVKTSASTMGTNLAGTIMEAWGSVSGVSAGANGALHTGPLVSAYYASTLAVSDVRVAVYRLKALNVPPYEGNDYVAIIPVEVAGNLVGDTTWMSFHQYAAPGQANLYSGEIGKIYGCRFVETNNGPIVKGSNDQTTNSAMIYGTLIMGKGFYGVTDLDGGIKTFITQGPDKSDPLNQMTTYGWKANFIAHVLNASAGLCLWTGNNTFTTIGTESATGSPLRYAYPSSY